jgi:protein involved in polysaccharide export with SLBB domain
MCEIFQRLIVAALCLLTLIFSSELLTQIWPGVDLVPCVQAQDVAAKPARTPAVVSEPQKAPISDYVVRPDDQLDISVLDVPEVSRVYRVSPHGFLTLPLFPEPIYAAGKTLHQLSLLITNKFHDAGMLESAQVTVQRPHTEVESEELKKAVYILGAVQKPGSYPLPRGNKLTTTQAVAQAGGLNQTAKRPARITIIRIIQNGTRTAISVDLNKVLEGKEVDVELSAGDILFIPARNPKPQPLYDPPTSPSPQPPKGRSLAS